MSQHPVFTCKVRPEAVVVVLQEAVQQLGHVVRGLGGGHNGVRYPVDKSRYLYGRCSVDTRRYL